MKALGHGSGIDEVTTANAAHQVNIDVADFERNVGDHIVHLNVQLIRFHLQWSQEANKYRLFTLSIAASQSDDSDVIGEGGEYKG